MFCLFACFWPLTLQMSPGGVILPSRYLQITSTHRRSCRAQGLPETLLLGGLGLRMICKCRRKGKTGTRRAKGPKVESCPPLDQRAAGSLSPWQEAPQHAMSDKKPLQGAHFFKGKM